jgi:uncharacterized protein YjbJ (UPF0337 family)
MTDAPKDRSTADGISDSIKGKVTEAKGKRDMRTKFRKHVVPTLALLGWVTLAVGVATCKSGRENVAEGSATEAKGKAESALGDVTGNDKTKADGQIDQAKGKTQKAVGKAQEKVDQAMHP